MCILKTIKLAVAGIFVLFAASILATSSYARIDPNSVVGLWLLDEDIDSEDNVATDSSENGHHGTIKGNPEWDEGKFGDALVFHGGADVVDCGNDESLNLGVFTVAFWAKFPTTQGWNHMVSKGDHVTAGNPGSVNWGVMMRDGEARFLFEIFEDTEWTGISSPVVGIDEWQHLVATYNGDKMEFFLNGVSLGSQTGVKVKLDASRSFLVGARASAAAPASYFNGSIDEVGLFNEVLALEDIRDIMNNGLADALNLTNVLPAGKYAATWAEIKTRY